MSPGCNLIFTAFPALPAQAALPAKPHTGGPCRCFSHGTSYAQLAGRTSSGSPPSISRLFVSVELVL